MSRRRPNDRDLQDLAISIKHVIKQNEGLIGDQQAQVEKLVSLERQFCNSLQRYSRTAEVYDLFINYICIDVDNILTSQSFFRERASVFRSSISPAIKNRDITSLMKFDINYKLVKFIVDNWGGKLPKLSNTYYEQLVETRRILIENNLPLAINRAKIFYNKTPRSHMNLLDLIDICVYGLIVGVDKHSGDYSKTWCSVSIGRMVGFMIEEYSKTFIRMFPADKKILYRANALKHRMKLEKIEDLTEAVNESFYKDKKEGKKVPKLPIEEIKIRTLMNGSGYISADNKITDDGEENMCIYDYTAHPDSVEDQVEKKDMVEKVFEASNDLKNIERKIIKLKGVEL